MKWLLPERGKWFPVVTLHERVDVPCPYCGFPFSARVPWESVMGTFHMDTVCQGCFAVSQTAQKYSPW